MTGFNYLLNYLKDEGFKVNEEENHFSFKYQGSPYIAFKNDSPFLQIVMICTTKEFTRSRLLDLCNELNGDKFVVKFVVMDETVWCSYEFIPTNNTSNEEFETALVLLDKASDEMFEKLK